MPRTCASLRSNERWVECGGRLWRETLSFIHRLGEVRFIVGGAPVEKFEPSVCPPYSERLRVWGAGGARFAAGVAMAPFETSMGEDFQRGDIAKAKTQVGFKAAVSTRAEELFKERTIGLKTKEEFAGTKSAIEADLNEEKERAKREADESEVRRLDDRRKKKKKKASAAAAKLSFADDEEVEAENEGGGSKEGDAKDGSRFGKLGKNPAVKTDFLPDRDRELEDAKEAIRLKEEYRAAMKAKLESSFDLHFLYWQSRGMLGQDVRKIKCVMSVKYGDSVADLLNRFRDDNHREYPELAHLTGEQCMFAKEGLIVPGHHTWFELINTGCVVQDKDVFKDLDSPKFVTDKDKANEKKAGLEVKESLKLYSYLDAGCVMDRKWFDRNSKTFPMCKWEVYNPRKDYRTAFVGDAGPAVVNTEHVS